MAAVQRSEQPAQGMGGVLRWDSSLRHFPDRRDTMSRRPPPKAHVVAGIAMAAFLLAGSASSAQQASEAAAQIELFKTSVTNGVEARHKLAQLINDTVFSFGELAYQEFETSKYLTTLLENNGFTV